MGCRSLLVSEDKSWQTWPPPIPESTRTPGYQGFGVEGVFLSLPTSEGHFSCQVDAEQYYSELEEQLTDEFNAEFSRVRLRRLDLMFVTFQNVKMARR